ncbi:MAG: S9 family peptidase [Thermoprotei archaeon]|jgi:acylaminoacyl-peptidase
MMRAMRIEDLEKIVLVSDPKISPKATHIAFTVTKPSIKDDKYFSRIWLLNMNNREYEQITNGPSDHSPEWSPDGKMLSFISRRTIKEEEEGSELWITNIDRTYEPRLLVKFDKPIFNVNWSPDSKKILFISRVGKRDEDVKTIEEIPIWFNGEGFIYNTRTHLFIVDVLSGNYEQVTNGNFDVEFAKWSPDGKKIAFISMESRMRPYITDINILDIKSHEIVKLTKSNMMIHDLDWDPTSKYLAFRGHNLHRGLATHTKVWLLNAQNGEILLLTDTDKDTTNSMNSDVRGPSSSWKIQWIDNYIYFHIANRGNVELCRVNTKKDMERVISGDFVVEDFSVSKDFIAVTLMNSVTLPELYIYRSGLEKITSFNDTFLSEVELRKPEHFSFKASDGEIIDGWILKPFNFDKNKKYPAILYIHGGPATAYGEGFIHEFHVLSTENFAVIFTNPRGSTGYSESFRDIRGNYGNRDYLDLMEALDYVIKNYTFIDENRIGVIGGSYGGFMTNWIIGHTDRFKAAVTDRSISNWISDYGTTDIGFYFNEDQIAGEFGRPFWDEKWFNKYWDSSPLKYASNIKTPLLIIHSLEDYRCWLDQALQLFTILKVRNIPARLILFPKENHDLSRKGKPKHRAERLKNITEWFKKYLTQ